jgi:membrane protease YdiL (CAAX protease family)
MKITGSQFKPAVASYLLLLIAGIVWFLVGCMLMALAFTWLSRASGINTYPFAVIGAVFALLIHHLGFLKIADKNLKRILVMRDKSCIFAFIPWKSYLIIAVMISMGAVLRHSIIPKHYLAVLYIAIGFALVLSSVRYIRVFIQEIQKR